MGLGFQVLIRFGVISGLFGYWVVIIAFAVLSGILYSWVLPEQDFEGSRGQKLMDTIFYGLSAIWYLTIAGFALRGMFRDAKGDKL